MKLSVILICWNSLGFLREALASLTESLGNVGEHEIILIDNGSTDGTDQFIASQYPQVVYRRLPVNKGVAYARNRGMEIAQGEYLWLLDDDTIVNTRAIDTMMRYMELHPHCGICGCRLVDAQGNTQQSYKTYPGLGVKLRNLFMKGSDYDYYADRMAEGEPFEPVYIMGACQLIRREVVERIGLLDEKIFYGPEDADYCLRARAAGWRVAYLPHASIVHHWQRITNRNPFTGIARKHTMALLYFYCKHRRIC